MLADMSINAEQVRSLRESRGWSQEHLAEVSGLSLRTIQRVEAEGRGSRETRLSLAAAFDVPLGRLSGDDAVGRAAGGEIVANTLTLVGTLIVVSGLLAGLNPALLVAGSALLISALSVHALDHLNGLRRAAGLPPILGSPTAEAGLTILIAGLVILLLGYFVLGQLLWIPGGLLVLFGGVGMLGSFLTRRWLAPRA